MALLVSGLAGTALAAQYSTTPRESDPRATASARRAPERIRGMPASVPAWFGGGGHLDATWGKCPFQTRNRPLAWRPSKTGCGCAGKRVSFFRGRRRLSPPSCTSGRSSLLPGVWSSSLFSLASAGRVCWAKPNHAFFDCQHFCNTNVPMRPRDGRRWNDGPALASGIEATRARARVAMAFEEKHLKIASHRDTRRSRDDVARCVDAGTKTGRHAPRNGLTNSGGSAPRRSDFASQHPICAKSRAMAGILAGYRGRSRAVRDHVPNGVAGNETGRLRGRI